MSPQPRHWQFGNSTRGARTICQAAGGRELWFINRSPWDGSHSALLTRGGAGPSSQWVCTLGQAQLPCRWLKFHRGNIQTLLVISTSGWMTLSASFFAPPAEACIGRVLNTVCFGGIPKPEKYVPGKNLDHLGQWASPLEWGGRAPRGETNRPQYKLHHLHFVSGITRALTLHHHVFYVFISISLIPALADLWRPLHCWATMGRNPSWENLLLIHLFLHLPILLSTQLSFRS